MATGSKREHMELWRPAAAEPELVAWWQPLVLVSREARRHQIRWPVHVDEFELVGRVDRRSEPSVWIYQHRQSRGCIHADGEGRTYRYAAANGAAPGCFEPIDVPASIQLADLPEVVEPVEYRTPSRPALALVGPASGAPASTARQRSTAAHPANAGDVKPSAQEAGGARRRWLHAVPSTAPA